jgi:hypothetical protein
VTDREQTNKQRLQAASTYVNNLVTKLQGTLGKETFAEVKALTKEIHQTITSLRQLLKQTPNEKLEQYLHEIEQATNDYDAKCARADAEFEERKRRARNQFLS